VLRLWMLNQWLARMLLRWSILGGGLRQIPLALETLFILLLVLAPQLLPLLLWLGFVVLDTPSFLFFPISFAIPIPPVMLKLSLGNALIVPVVATPIALTVVSSPFRIHIVIKIRNPAIMPPSPVVIM